MKKSLLIATSLLIGLASCSDNDSFENENQNNNTVINLPAKQQWSHTYDGADETVPQYPDLYSHYWQYVWSVKQNPNMVLKIHGAYPHCRYFSFSLYNDDDGSAINGSSDYMITPDEGSVNPFVQSSSNENYYTVYIVPETVSDAKLAQLGANKNIIKVSSSVEQANIMIRQYMSVDQNGNPDEYGGVDMPAIKAYDITTMKEVTTPKTLDGNVETKVQAFAERKTDVLNDVPFMRAPHGSFYPNKNTDYLYARTKVTDDQVLTFSFIPVPMPSKVEEYSTAKARYWSICVGSAVDTRSYYSINYDQAKVKDGEKVTFVVCTKQNPQLAAIEQRVKDENAKGANWQIIVWDSSKLSYPARKNGTSETIGNTMVLMYRNILPDTTWQYSISQMEPTAYYDLSDPNNPKLAYQIAYEDPQHKVASYAVGDYGPHGKKVTTNEFLAK